MRRLLIVAILLLAGCSAAPERIALRQIGENLTLMGTDWRAYVRADATLDEAAREDRLELWAATAELVRAGLGEEDEDGD